MIRRTRRKRHGTKAVMFLAIVFCSIYFIVLPCFGDRLLQGGEPPAPPDTPAEPVQATAEKEILEYLILINKTHGLDKAYKPGDLKKVAFATGKHRKLRRAAAEAFDDLAKDAEEQGLTIRMTSGYRSYLSQKRLYEKYFGQDGKIAEQYSAKPGHSEHQTGLCADVVSPSTGYRLVQSYGATKEGKWLAQNAHNYGFIIRYPEGKEKITGYEYEPWHIRYAGVGAASEIYGRNLTLEEYLESNF